MPADFKGQKMRVNDDIIGATVTALTGAPVFLSAGEMYMALQRGTIDGMHTGISSMVERKLYEVCQNGSDDNHDEVAYTLSINLK
jgi:TRAP-type C4-dicarboxylate transport system substrate-binding protein